MNTGRTYSAKVEEVHSGDDFVLLIDLGVDGLYKRTRCRLHGVDAPNAYRAKSDTEAGLVRDEVKRLVSTAGRCHVELISEGKGGWIVRMTLNGPSGEDFCLNTLLRDRGYVYHSQQSQDTQHEQ